MMMSQISVNFILRTKTKMALFEVRLVGNSSGHTNTVLFCNLCISESIVIDLIFCATHDISTLICLKLNLKKYGIFRNIVCFFFFFKNI